MIVGLPALRLRGLFLSVATLGFALAVSSWLFYQGWLVHSSPETGTLDAARPAPFRSASTSTTSAATTGSASACS